MRCGIIGNLDAGDLERVLGLLQKEAIGATDLQKPAARAMTAQEGNRLCEFAAQDVFSSTVVRVPVDVAAREIPVGVISVRVEATGVCAADAAFVAAKDLAAVFAVEMPMELVPI